MIAEDNRGAQYNYGESGFPENSPDTSAVEWFGNPELCPDAAEDGFAASVELASRWAEPLMSGVGFHSPWSIISFLHYVVAKQRVFKPFRESSCLSSTGERATGTSVCALGSRV